MTVIKPVGDRLLVKLCRQTEKKIGDTTLTLPDNTRRKYQPECSKAQVLAAGNDVAQVLNEGDVILIRSDAGVGLTQDVLARDDARLYRVIEYPEVIAVLEETKDISEPNEVCQRMEVVS